ncbi:hypothetical protein GUITHDRAFT_135558 [Guillardia theta CCMP2712]|uniref:Pinin/SDK/MemA protein domain-containing protein n=1 Tax=Guillardia theta (strain CCMP2712) TaxID=905079 RepID=L1JP77_GUITC|nr:hypothetical protein GUITHDRAFT_135558 [Guillardia theta CCMP2712]EKX49853.1 hypothetical protein GUITHDRAFT_135558 [Guillardia theta CCMP2712]|eukprot:XP_005836833.1 hypothetical protein GUITHDRAFT_135558 [Guillardia theta CCMP2712]
MAGEPLSIYSDLQALQRERRQAELKLRDLDGRRRPFRPQAYEHDLRSSDSTDLRDRLGGRFDRNDRGDHRDFDRRDFRRDFRDRDMDRDHDRAPHPWDAPKFSVQSAVTRASEGPRKRKRDYSEEEEEASDDEDREEGGGRRRRKRGSEDKQEEDEEDDYNPKLRMDNPGRMREDFDDRDRARARPKRSHDSNSERHRDDKHDRDRDRDREKEKDREKEEAREKEDKDEENEDGKSKKEKEKDDAKDGEKEIKTPRSAEKTDIRGRNRRMFGNLLGQLQKAKKQEEDISKSQIMQKRHELEVKVETKAKENSEKLKEEFKIQQREERRKNLEKIREIRSKQQEMLHQLSLMRAKKQSKLESRFIRTKSEPHIYWIPKDTQLEKFEKMRISRLKQLDRLSWKPGRRH